MYKTKILIAGVLLSVMPFIMAHAQRTPGTLSFGGFGGIGLPMKPSAFKDYWKMGIGFGGELKYNFSEMSSFSASFTYLPFKLDQDAFKDLMTGMVPGMDVEISGGNIKTNIISANFLQYFTPPEASASLYFTAGGGYYMFKPGDVTLKITYQGQTVYEGTQKVEESENGFGVNGGVGLEMTMGTNMFFFVEGKYHYTFVEMEGDEEMGLESGKVSFITVMAGLRISR